ncbi:DUF1870 family protein [Acidovorax sp. LjRoot129]|uniref:Aca2/YdiL-like domain-containing protein n=1 Tax=unclassified Acidovorax TaxID=2684926 RepID=UPI003ECEF509
MKTPHLNTGLRIQLIRSVLFLQPAEASAMFSDMTPEKWAAIEAGQEAAPDHVIKKLENLFNWRNHQLAMTRQMMVSNPTCTLNEFWHATIDDWMAIDEREPEHFRAAQSLAASLATEYPTQFKLYPFDLAAFTAWASGRPGTDELQSHYLAMISEPMFNAHR